ncbi:YrhC family protein [Thalassobacillus sp. CUG 92003]|uniref:YrhC family protein n=1 Tax=Thalassobacillus sp. CUG 92003 TaxID=2736641 RepID=UPI0015E66D75|nr:YrhC family protein [Thalassobacillus sp. CUG 92003]
MDNATIEATLKDYLRFVGTLIILCCYLYTGSLISLYIYHTSTYEILLLITCGLLALAFLLIGRIVNLKRMRDTE